MTRELTVHVSDKVSHVAALLLRPDQARWLLVLAHGAGAGMRHAFMEWLARELAASEMAMLRYQFPYMQQRRGRPDPPALLTATVRVASKTRTNHTCVRRKVSSTSSTMSSSDSRAARVMSVPGET